MFKISEIQVSYKPKKASRPQINSSNTAANILRDNFENIEFKEFFKVLILSRSNRVLGIYHASDGGLTSSIADVRQIMAVAITANAAGLIVSHNHPSGNLLPSKTDKDLTQRLKQACNLFDINLLDHIIMTEESYFSFADEGLL